MTNPIMPGIEKLAEKYGINVNNSFKPVVKSKSNSIVEDDDCYILKNIYYEGFIGDVHLTKKLLQNGKTFCNTEWKTLKFLTSENHVDYEIPSLHGYFDIFEYLNSKKEDSILVQKIIKGFQTDLTLNNILTSSKIIYDKDIDLFYKNFNIKVPLHTYMKGPSGHINTVLFSDNYLFDLTSRKKEKLCNIINIFDIENKFIKRPQIVVSFKSSISMQLKHDTFIINTENNDDLVEYAARGIKFLRK